MCKPYGFLKRGDGQNITSKDIKANYYMARSLDSGWAKKSLQGVLMTSLPSSGALPLKIIPHQYRIQGKTVSLRCKVSLNNNNNSCNVLRALLRSGLF